MDKDIQAIYLHHLRQHHHRHDYCWQDIPVGSFKQQNAHYFFTPMIIASYLWKNIYTICPDWNSGDDRLH